jgi:hypothetical protein
LSIDYYPPVILSGVIRFACESDHGVEESLLANSAIALSGHSRHAL